MKYGTKDFESMVDWKEGLISPQLFIDEDIYKAEQEKLFGRAWLFLAHDSMIPKANDFFTTYMGGDPVLVTRRADGSVGAYLNACRHRGMRVCRAEDGNAKFFTCTYHGWAYDTSGKLVNVPNLDDAYYSELDTAENGLVPVAKVENYRGFIFGTFDETAPPLTDYLGDMKFFIDGLTDHAEDGIEVLPGVIKWTIHSNWKLAAEQFAGDGYHAVTTHASSIMQMRETIDPVGGGQASFPEGHGVSYMFNENARFGNDALGAYFENRTRVGNERVGERIQLTGNFNVFPNLSGLLNGNDIRVWHPKGPNSFEVWKFCIVDKNASEEVRKELQRTSGMTEGAAGVVEVDDGENWDLIGRQLAQGTQVRKIAWNYRMGLGHEEHTHNDFPGRLGSRYFGEGPQRAFYRRWVEYMTSEQWPHVQGDATTAAVSKEA
ncbi:aromatic ring-hydroxylating dioxygenase subunit alpha [Rhodococcus sp. 05-2256-B2]|uniref:aromatic ring-hydroxylating oxygenase subunit alpha n=1 Tax=unclassified Rhodococcus (in: high G+C Gram-positive bacteria) TaxID=192944 RepID=UPI000B9A989A|nr:MULTISPECIES: aromatic ring-hydroxylating dioxygenase subunit alpha [unclassified Rhodococcus (in: high G+C Gram-positive bacteria)]MBY4383822.1 Rieske 2Fe-2S domain-containing protein [Rhodococcus fascians]MBY4399033.1 Rieske 2Fe-2S domain-containing protein [Rhodococcus fascians]MBY4408571.1 Rieske 2Fe-2S domain-containing protein [Rhodococcus fascians]MBY4423610.1 Rieske 2Fe-2S domain-containing protein [Rhodococcus fascians]MBY4462866.1 Rieske 2Fe-2S domain-containing protein [Rhodococc